MFGIFTTCDLHSFFLTMLLTATPPPAPMRRTPPRRSCCVPRTPKQEDHENESRRTVNQILDAANLKAWNTQQFFMLTAGSGEEQDKQVKYMREQVCIIRVCVCACGRVCSCVRVCILCASVGVSMYVCVFVCGGACMYVCICVHDVCVCIDVCMCVRV